MIAFAVMLQAGASFCVAASLAVYVAMLRRKSGPQWTLLGILAGISVWCAGVFVAWSQPENSRVLEYTIPMIFLGSCFVPGLTFHLAARCSHVRIVEDQPLATAVAMLVPGSLSYLLLLTNPMHGLFLASTGFEILTSSASVWAGPVFWIHLVVSYVFTAAAMLVSGVAACRAGRTLERRQLVLLALSSAVPLVANAVYVFGLAPIPFPLTYAGLGVSGLLLVLAIARYGFIESFVPARDVIAHLRTGIILADSDGRVVSANEAAEKLLGCSVATIHGKQLSASIEPLDPEGALSRLVGDPSGTDLAVATIETPNERLLEVHSGYVRSRKGTIVAQFVVLDDRTEQRHYERIRQRVDRLEAISALVAGLSHEINNPLAFVQANVSHVVRTAPAVEKALRRIDHEHAAEVLEMGEAAAEALTGLDRIREVVSSTKQLLSDPTAPREIVDLNRTVRDALTLSGLDRADSLNLDALLHPSSLPIHGSAVQLGQLALNLLLNARDAVADREHAEIRVETLRCDACDACPGGAELRVDDNGPGIPAEQRDKIFAPFFTTKGPGEGTGLGLAICAEIVRDHDGTIDVSRSLLGGACFSVRFPSKGRCCNPGDQAFSLRVRADLR